MTKVIRIPRKAAPSGNVNVTNSDGTYNVNVACGSPLVLPDITHTDSTLLPVTLPAQTPFIATPSCRSFTTLDGVNKRMDISTLTLTGAFDIEFYYLSTNATIQVLLGDSTGTNNFVSNNSGAGISVKINGVQDNFSFANIDDGKWHKINISRSVSNNVVVSVDDLPIGSNIKAGNFVLDRVSTYNGNTLPSNGITSEVKVFDHTISTTEPIRYYKINEDWRFNNTLFDYGTDGLNGLAVNITYADAENFCYDNGDWIASEILSNHDFVQGDTLWSKLGTALITTNKASLLIVSDAIGKLGVLKLSTNYILSYNILKDSSGGLITNRGGTALVVPGMSTAVGSHSYIQSSNSTGNLDFYFSLGATAISDLECSSVSLKRILQAP